MPWLRALRQSPGVSWDLELLPTKEAKQGMAQKKHLKKFHPKSTKDLLGARPWYKLLLSGLRGFQGWRLFAAKDCNFLLFIRKTWCAASWVKGVDGSSAYFICSTGYHSLLQAGVYVKHSGGDASRSGLQARSNGRAECYDLGSHWSLGGQPVVGLPQN